MKVAWDDPRVGPDWTRLYGDLIQAHGPWSWWLTLTFRYPVMPSRAKEVFARWATTLAGREVRSHVRLAWVLDGNGEHWHFHTLVGFPEHVSATRERLKQLWLDAAPGLTGFITDIHEYDPQRGAAFYIAKKLTVFEWGLDTACGKRPACRRGKGCRFSSSAWR
jgi:hypothetical protein